MALPNQVAVAEAVVLSLLVEEEGEGEQLLSGVAVVVLLVELVVVLLVELVVVLLVQLVVVLLVELLVVVKLGIERCYYF